MITRIKQRHITYRIKIFKVPKKMVYVPIVKLNYNSIIVNEKLKTGANNLILRHKIGVETLIKILFLLYILRFI